MEQAKIHRGKKQGGKSHMVEGPIKTEWRMNGRIGVVLNVPTVHRKKKTMA